MKGPNPKGFAIFEAAMLQPPRPPMLVRVMDGEECLGVISIRDDESADAAFDKLKNFAVKVSRDRGQACGLK